jgi:predicted sulfurtransferase
MAKHEETLSEKIKSIEKNANPKNMEIIYKELNSLASSETKLKKHLKEACKLINLIGTFLVKGEGLNTTESQLIFDTFCDMDFMSILLKYSSFDYYEINLEIITTFSFLMINIKSKTYLY